MATKFRDYFYSRTAHINKKQYAADNENKSNIKYDLLTFKWSHGQKLVIKNKHKPTRVQYSTFIVLKRNIRA